MKLDSIFDLTGKVAVVTGGGDGIGRGCCETLAAAGASVVVSDINPDKARDVAYCIIASGGKAISVKCNVTLDADLIRLVDSAVSAFGTVNILVNNAGMGGGGRENPFKIDMEYFEKIWGIVKNLCLGVKIAEPENKKFGIVYAVQFSSESFDL